MELQELRAELSIKTIEFEQALSAGFPHTELIKIYRRMKELQYELIVAKIKNPLAEHADVSRKQRKNCHPVSGQGMTESAVSHSNENQNIGDAVGQVIENLATPACLPGCQCDHPVQHVEPEPHITEQRRDEQETAPTA